MSEEAKNSTYVDVLQQLSFFCFTATLVIGVLNLSGWILEIEVLKRFIAASPVMVPRTSISIVAMSVAFLINRNRKSKNLLILEKVLSVGVLIWALETLIRYIFGLGYYFEDGVFYFSNTSTLNLIPAPETAISLAFISASLLFQKSPRHILKTISEVLLILSGGIGLIAISGYFLGSNSLYSFFIPLKAIGMSLPTALSLFLLTVGGFTQDPSHGFSSLLVSRSSGGEIARKLIVVLFFMPMIIEGLIGLLVSVGNIEPSFRYPIMMILTFGTFLSLSWVLARRLDLSEKSQMKLQEKLREKEKMYRDLFEMAPEGIFVANPDGVYTEVNESACKLLGYSREELVGLTIKDILAEEEIERFESMEKMTIFEKKSISIAEWKHKRKDGTYFMSEVCAQMLPNGRWLAFMRNIDERKQFDEQISRKQAKYRALFESLYDGVVVVDSEGTIQMANPQMEYWFGYKPEELTGKKVEILIPNILQQEDFFKHPISRPMGSIHDLYGKRKSGTVFPIDISLSPGIDEDGNVIVTAMIRDISAQKENEQREQVVSLIGQKLPQLQNLRDRLRAGADILVLNVVSWGSIHLRAGHSANMDHLDFLCRDESKKKMIESLRNYHLANEVLDDMLKYMSGKPGILVRNDYMDSFLRRFIPEQCIEEIHQLGTHAVVVIPIIARERPMGMMILGKKSENFDRADLEFLRTAVDQIATNADNALLYQQAMNSSKMREDLVAIISHDLKSPLSVIRLRSEALASLTKSNKSPEEINDAILRSTGKIEAAVQRSLTLISDLLDFAKMEAGGFGVEVKEENSMTLLQETLDAHIALANAKGINLTIQTIQKLTELPHVAADFSRILQVLSNLVSNAIKFTERGGEVSLEARPFGEDKVLFIVKDTGMGIGEEEKAHVFDRYWQPYRNRNHGSGLGLSIVKGIIEAHGGQIWLESKLGIGSSFYFTLPVFQDVNRSQIWKGDMGGQDLRSDQHPH